MKTRSIFLLKRGIDVAVSLLALVILSPLLLAIALGLLLTQGWPFLFSDQRAGYRGRTFNLYKFRTMRVARGSEGSLLPDVERVTRFGRFLRRTSLDELPEFFNVLVGDMSLVGPRPLPISYLPLYSERQRRRHDVRPGLTGLAQVRGRNQLSWEQRFAYDLAYVDRAGLWLDLNILIATVVVVVTGRGVEPYGGFTSEPFRGQQELG